MSANINQNPDIQLIPCSICNRPTYGFLYGVPICDPCRVFFYRKNRFDLTYECKKENNCEPNGQNYKFLCRACRYAKCVRCLLRPDVYNRRGPKQVTNNELPYSGLLDDLKGREACRMNLWLTQKPAYNTKYSDPEKVGELVFFPTVLIEASATISMTGCDWCQQGCLSAIRFLTSFEFVKGLDTEDRKLIVKNFFISVSVLGSAFKSRENNSIRMITPNNQDFYPDRMLIYNCFSRKYMRRIRSQLIDKLVELNITKEEMLLVQMVLFLNPALPSLSKHGIAEISRLQKCYSSALYEHCRIKNAQNAPTRYTDLLSLFHVIKKNNDDVNYYYMMLELVKEEVPDLLSVWKVFRAPPPSPSEECSSAPLSNPVSSEHLMQLLSHKF